MGKSKSLVIVESPAKIKTINKILGDDYKVCASMGHLVDLPVSSFGVDIENNFEPHFIIVRKKRKQLNKIKKEAEKKKEIYIATDPDREGEAIGWHLAQTIGDGKKIHRVVFHEITKEAVRKAFAHPKMIDQKKIESQTARRVLDRIVGYQLSPLLWKKVGGGLSAGRVQSVALRILVDREREIEKFVPQEYWQIAIDLKKKDSPDVFSASLDKIDQEKFDIKNEKKAHEISEEIKKQNFGIEKITKRETRRNPLPPFITSTLQQEAFNKLHYNASRTMMIAQQLYEGIEIDGESTGLITYMRTDSVHIAKEAMEKVRGYIKKNYGEKYLPSKPKVYRSKKRAQEAHEAIRPTSVAYTPQAMAKYLELDQIKLYELIWNRFVACQMTSAVFDNRRMEIKAGRFQFSASGSAVKFDGFLFLQKEKEDSKASLDISKYQVGDHLEFQSVYPSQHFTKPPPHYSEGTLVKALEDAGIGRPSTYAPIIQTLVMRNYVSRDRGYFKAQELGMLICDMLIEYFPKIMDIGFTATMEEDLDLIEEGRMEYGELLKEFYRPFKEELDYAMANIEKTENYFDKRCPKCNRQLVVKWGRNGKFLSCSGFPKCKYSESFPIGVKCPQENCPGELVERRSKRGAIFYGCNQYPACRYISNKLPVDGENNN